MSPNLSILEYCQIVSGFAPITLTTVLIAVLQRLADSATAH